VTISNKENYIKEGNVQHIIPASTTEISIGELLKYDSSNDVVAPFDAIGDSSTFIGVAGSASASGEVDPVLVYKKGVFEFDIDTSAIWYENDTFRWSAAKRTVSHSTSNIIGRLFKRVTASDSKVRLKIDSYVAW